ncbi:MAG: aldo/keto reductase [Thermoleophilia bacterium]|nr:aldo/keto reductase [Thermoleophilia bacterium]
MRYRKFGRLEWESSILGLGVSRLPGTQGYGRGAIDAPETDRLMRHGIDQGINYVDLGFPWDMEGQETVVRAVRGALEHGYRDRVRLALTVPASLISSPEDFDACLDRQLGWLGSDGVDLCLLGRLTRDNWPRLESTGVLDSLEKAQRDGRAGAVGFSFYDQYQVLKSIVGAYDRWALCSVEYSYMDVKHNPGTNGIRWAAGQGLAVVVTRPLKGGRLTKEPPDEVRRIWAQSARQWSLAEWGLRFVWNEPGVSVVVCDMNSMEQLTQNLTVADTAEPNSLSIAEEVAISNAADAFRKRQRVPCPSCRPCMPCPEGIDVPRFFEIYNDALVYDDIETARALCDQEQIHPGDCTECGICERRCTKRLHMIDWLKEGKDYLGIR